MFVDKRIIVLCIILPSLEDVPEAHTTHQGRSWSLRASISPMNLGNWGADGCRTPLAKASFSNPKSSTVALQPGSRGLCRWHGGDLLSWLWLPCGASVEVEEDEGRTLGPTLPAPASSRSELLWVLMCWVILAFVRCLITLLLLTFFPQSRDTLPPWKLSLSPWNVASRQPFFWIWIYRLFGVVSCY